MRGKKAAGAALRYYLGFFLLTAFLITSSMLLFLHYFQLAVEFEYTAENLGIAALMTFGNVLFLTAICTGVDVVRRKVMVDRPVRKIAEAAERLTKGDLSARIDPKAAMGAAAGFDDIIRCFNRMAEELSGVETLRTDFIANVSHELKTPLAVMQNYGTMLQQPGLSEADRLEYAKAVNAASRRLADLITNILKLSRLENQQIFPEGRDFDLGEQLCECLLDFESVWEEKNIEIDTEIGEDIHINSDPELLALVWHNLFSNALKFTEPGGTVSLSLKTEGDFALVTVKDTGCGMSPEVSKHIFEKFYQGDTSHTIQGNGLGLALVKRVMDILRGEISVTSEVGKGSAFTVRLRTGEDGTA